MDLHIGVIRVRLAGQQSLDLARVRFLTELAQSRLGFGNDTLVILFFAKGGEGDVVVEFGVDLIECAERPLELLTFAHQALRARRIVPEIRGFGLAVEFG
ncbi:MAG: hypothetical protein A49_07460 [Methyloceanibacter sp.]|nr:MAG: hypothetical protein A49_07460 [Methyloceanibacter sp.]